MIVAIGILSITQSVDAVVTVSWKGLSESEFARLRRALPMAIEGEGHALLVVGGEDELGAAEQVLRRFVAERAQSDRVLRALTGSEGMLGEERVVQLHKQAERRRRFLEEVHVLTSAEVADLAGSEAANRSALANRWRKEGKVFALRLGSRDAYPAFQFSGEDGSPLPALARVIELFEGAHDWTLALWFNAPSSWLDGARPRDLLEGEADRVVDAARRALEPPGV